jgi:4-hydroxyphenylpyruvate dioxygenase
MVLANNSEMILLPINEPTFGTKRKSQIQTYLEQNEGAGLQHLALKTDDIVSTLREMRKRSDFGGFDFMPNLGPTYYKALPERIGDALPAEKYKECEELGILVDIDDQGVLLQIFTKPLGDRPTVFIEIIQRLCKAEEQQRQEQEEEVLERCLNRLKSMRQIWALTNNRRKNRPRKFLKFSYKSTITTVLL